jgi:hypothetical protein
MEMHIAFPEPIDYLLKAPYDNDKRVYNERLIYLNKIYRDKYIRFPGYLYSQ